MGDLPFGAEAFDLARYGADGPRRMRLAQAGRAHMAEPDEVQEARLVRRPDAIGGAAGARLMLVDGHHQGLHLAATVTPTCLQYSK